MVDDKLLFVVVVNYCAVLCWHVINKSQLTQMDPRDVDRVL